MKMSNDKAQMTNKAQSSKEKKKPDLEEDFWHLPLSFDLKFELV